MLANMALNGLLAMLAKKYRNLAINPTFKTTL